MDHTINQGAIMLEIFFFGKMARQSDGLGSGKFAALAVEDDDHPALKPHQLLHFEQDRTDDFAQIQAAFQRVGDIEQQI